MTTWSMSSPSPEGIVPFVEPGSAPPVPWRKARHGTRSCLSRRSRSAARHSSRTSGGLGLSAAQPPSHRVGATAAVRVRPGAACPLRSPCPRAAVDQLHEGHGRPISRAKAAFQHAEVAAGPLPVARSELTEQLDHPLLVAQPREGQPARARRTTPSTTTDRP